MKKIMYILFFVISFSFCVNVNASGGVAVESITPIYDEESSIIVNEKDGRYEAIFNDKNQIVKYKVVLKNITNNEIHLNKVELSEPSEEFLEYTFDINSSNDYFKSGETKEIVLSLKTIDIAGWGRNFDDKLGATFKFEEAPINPNTSTDKKILMCFIVLSMGLLVVVFRKNSSTKYIVLVIAMGYSLTIINAKETIDLKVETDVSFVSQNVMKMAYTRDASNKMIFDDYWIYADKIKNIYVNNVITNMTNFVYSFDVSDKQNKKVMAYLVENAADANYYDLYLEADGIIYPNENASYYFSGMLNLDRINNLSGIDTSNVMNMELLFSETGYNSKIFELDLSDFDTSNVTSMKGMFQKIGYSNEEFLLDVSNFDTSNVTDFTGMFSYAGYNSKNFDLDVSGFDTSSATTFRAMFQKTGYNSEIFTLDVSGFDTSNVTNMRYMFAWAGYNSPLYKLDVSNFDTSQVTDMFGMFAYAGNNADEFVLDLTNFDTRNVTDMAHMFNNLGGNSSKVYLDVSSFDTSKVTDMKVMFQLIGENADNVTILLGEKFDTANVTDMSHMFNGTGYSSDEFYLDLSSLDTTSVVNTMSMFSYLGCASTKLNTSITIRNPNVTIYDNMFEGVATKPGSQIVVNYTKETEALADKMIATKSGDSNVIKGVQVD